MLVTIIISSSLFLPVQIEGTFTTPVGTVCNYTIENAKLDANINGEYYYCEGITFDDQHYDEGAAIEVNATMVVNDWIMTSVTLNEGETEIWNFYDDWVELNFALYLTFMHDIAENIVFNGNESILITQGMWLDTLVKTFFLPVNNVSQIMEIIEGIPTKVEGAITTVTAISLDYNMYEHYDTTETELIFEWLFKGTQFIEDSVDIIFNNHLRVAYGKTNGELLGIKINGELSGEVSTIDLDLNADYLIEKDWYDIGTFSITLLNGITLPELLMGVGIGIIGITIISKRKKEIQK